MTEDTTMIYELERAHVLKKRAQKIERWADDIHCMYIERIGGSLSMADLAMLDRYLIRLPVYDVEEAMRIAILNFSGSARDVVCDFSLLCRVALWQSAGGS